LSVRTTRVRQQYIKVGHQLDQEWIVTDGLKGGEDVIIDGLQKVQPGQVVNAQRTPPPGQQASANSGSGGGQ